MPEPAAESSVGLGAMAALLLVIAVSVWLGALAQRAVDRGSFLKGFFLGNRGLGAWALALTATVQSGGTFMGFPSLVYSHGWTIALWIAGYMVVPITGFGVLGKRFAQLSRRTGAITVPDMFRERFQSPAVGLAASLLIIVFMSFMMVAQFKAGAVVMKIAWPGAGALALADDAAGGVDRAYYFGLGVFTLTVVGYTLIGGFLASVWTDLFQSVLMLFGVGLLFWLVVPWDSAEAMRQPTLDAIQQTSASFASAPGFVGDPQAIGHEVLPIGIAFSFFMLWVLGGFGSPASMVRVMASRSTRTIRRSIVLLGVYNMVIYLPLIIISVSARSIFPNLGAKHSDEMIPRLAFWATSDLPGGSFLSGLILAAPFGAVMATVSTYLVVIASGLVRDVYLRFINPHAGQSEVKLLSRSVMIALGLIGVAANIWPVQYLQAIVVFSGSSVAATLVAPAIMAAYWRRATASGAMAAMLVGAGVTFALYAFGWIQGAQGVQQPIGMLTNFRPHFLLGVEPLAWGLAASSIAGVLVSLASQPPPVAIVSRFFDSEPLQDALASD